MRTRTRRSAALPVNKRSHKPTYATGANQRTANPMPHYRNDCPCNNRDDAYGETAILASASLIALTTAIIDKCG